MERKRFVKGGALSVCTLIAGSCFAQADTFWLATSGSGNPGIQNFDRNGVTQRSIRAAASGVAVDVRSDRLYTAGTFRARISQYDLSTLGFISPQLIQVPGTGFKLDMGLRYGPTAADDMLLRTNYSHRYFQVVDFRHPNAQNHIAVTRNVSTIVPLDSRGAATGITWAPQGTEEFVFVALDSSATIWKYDYRNLAAPPVLFSDLSDEPAFVPATDDAFAFGGLAYDPVLNQIWIASGQRNTIYALDMGGVLTGQTITMLSGAYAFGLEYGAPVPSPSAMTLFASGLILAACRRR